MNWRSEGETGQVKTTAPRKVKLRQFRQRCSPLYNTQDDPGQGLLHTEETEAYPG